MMIVRDGVACVGIRGGDVEAVKSYFRQRSPRSLCQLERIVIYAGGNNLARREGATQAPRQPAKEVSLELESLTRFVLAFCPNASVTTADLIPRATKGFFNHRSRMIAERIIQQAEHRHHHASFLRGLLIISRLKGSEKYRPKELFFAGSDGVHMNSLGYRALIMITEWLLEAERRGGDSVRITVSDHNLAITMKF